MRLMAAFNTLSIRRKLMMIIIATSLITATITNLFLIIEELYHERSDVISQLTTLSDVIAINSAAPLMFNDRNTAADLLASLKNNQHIDTATLMTANGAIFCEFNRSSAPGPNVWPKIGSAGSAFNFQHFYLRRAITIDNEHVGFIYISYSLADLKKNVAAFLAVQLFVTALAVMIAIWFALRLKRSISEPIAHLAEVVDDVARTKDYAHRAVRTTDDEIGRLITGFNEMLQEIQRKNLELEEHRNNLELEVQQRTRELNSANEELLKSRKLESIGVLAGGIAHDFNNFLMIILGNLSIAKNLSGAGIVKERLEAAERASFRARDLTKQLLTFSRGGAPVKSIFSLATLIRESVALMLAGSNVRAEIDLPENLPQVYADDGQVIQVINNLLLNACHAMPNGGVVSIRAWDSCLTGACGDRVAGGTICLSVEDHGCGIPEEILPRIFDPYFSTKDNGAGLGLAMCYSIITNHGGSISVESQPGKGAVFTVCLPRPVVSPAARQAQPQQVIEALNHPLRILLMDDDEYIRSTTGIMLETLGHTSVSSSDGQEMLRLYREALEAGNRFDLVIMDLTIPGGMGGEEANRLLLEYDPKAVTLVSSGYANNAVMANHRSYGFKDVLAKPYRMEELRDVLQRVMAL